jgi:hypothetical protein
LRAVPSVARRTVGSIAKHAAKGHRVTPLVAVKTLARQTRRVLGTPRHRAHALRRHQVLERKFHRRWGRGMARPHLGLGRVAAPSRVAGAPYRVAAGGAPIARPGVRYGRYGRTVGGQCVCPACPSCGGIGPAQTVVAPTPAYCRCCGQVLR